VECVAPTVGISQSLCCPLVARRTCVTVARRFATSVGASSSSTSGLVWPLPFTPKPCAALTEGIVPGCVFVGAESKELPGHCPLKSSRACDIGLRPYVARGLVASLGMAKLLHAEALEHVSVMGAPVTCRCR
jgi:hypothetical protein